jgi:hypothetical protein
MRLNLSWSQTARALMGLALLPGDDSIMQDPFTLNLEVPNG